MFGIWLAIGHLVSAAAMAITLIGIPLALANLKLIPVSLMPLGEDVVAIVSTPAGVDYGAMSMSSISRAGSGRGGTKASASRAIRPARCGVRTFESTSQFPSGRRVAGRTRVVSDAARSRVSAMCPRVGVRGMRLVSASTIVGAVMRSAATAA